MSIRPSLLQHAATVALLLPPLAAVAAGSRMTPARRWVLVWCLLLAAQDAISLHLGSRGITNLWLGYIFRPIGAAALLWGLAHWQTSDKWRLRFRLAIPFVILASVILSVAVDDPRTFSLVAAPFHYLVLLLASLWTFLQLSSTAERPVHTGDWFWITGGIMLYAATAVAIQPLSLVFLDDRVELLSTAYNLRAGASLLALAAITWGMLCSEVREFSGGPSSPPSQRS